MPRGLTGARLSPRHHLLAAEPFRLPASVPIAAAWIPKQLSQWGNNQYGDCVSAEEAFAKACYQPEIFVPDQVVIEWARHRGYLNGADLSSVLDSMATDGFVISPQQYDDGKKQGVDYSSEPTLQAAIAAGPVKIAIASADLPSGAGNQSGWYAVGAGRRAATDHCVSLCGYGPAQWLYSQLGVPLPSALQPTQGGYLLYTWATIGYVDHAWIMGTCEEAWLRVPTTVGVPPLTPPTPTPPTPTPPTPTPPTPGTYTVHVPAFDLTVNMEGSR